jgi:hypothetical protein
MKSSYLISLRYQLIKKLDYSLFPTCFESLSIPFSSFPLNQSSAFRLESYPFPFFHFNSYFHSQSQCYFSFKELSLFSILPFCLPELNFPNLASSLKVVFISPVLSKSTAVTAILTLFHLCLDCL